MMHDFYSQYAVGYTLTGRITFTLIMLITFMLTPAGFILYFIMSWIWFSAHYVDKKSRIDSNTLNAVAFHRRNWTLFKERQTADNTKSSN